MRCAISAGERRRIRIRGLLIEIKSAEVIPNLDLLIEGVTKEVRFHNIAVSIGRSR